MAGEHDTFLLPETAPGRWIQLVAESETRKHEKALDFASDVGSGH
jgi:hypothetical protein